MFFRALCGLPLCVVCIIAGLILANNAQSSGAVFVGRIGGLEVQVQGDKALFSNDALIHNNIHNSNPLSLAMKNKGVEKIAIEPDKIEIYQYKNHFPDIIHLPMLIEPTPTATGIKSIDQTKGLQLLNSSVISLATTVIDKTVVFPTPTLSSSPTEYSAKTINHSEINVYQETQNTFYATASIPMLPPVSSIASEGDYIDLDFETSDTIRVYPKVQDSGSAFGFFEQIIRKVADSPEKKNDNGGQQQQQTTSSSTQSDNASSDDTNTSSDTGTSSDTSTSGNTATSTTTDSSTAVETASAPDEKADGTPEEPSSDKFVVYHSIENSSNQKMVDDIKAFIEKFSEQKLPWVVLEKIHGANYSFWTDGKIVRVGKRHDWLSDNDHFYNHHTVYEQYREMILDMHRKFCKEGDTLKVTGELYGRPIQKQIFYQDGLKFAAFDIFLNNRKIDYNDFKEWTLASGIPTAAELKMCDSFEEALSFNPVFPSLHSETGDTAEGVVIKPVKPKSLHNYRTVILKIKNPKFEETRSKKVFTKKIEDIAEENQMLLASLLAKVTKNRFYAVSAKLGGLTESNIKKFVGEFIRDMIDEYDRENEPAAKTKVNDKKQWKRLLDEVSKAINELIKAQSQVFQ